MMMNPLHETTTMTENVHNARKASGGMLGDKTEQMQNQINNTQIFIGKNGKESFINSHNVCATPAIAAIHNASGTNASTPLFRPRHLLPSLETLPSKPELTVVFDLDETLVYNRRMDLNYALLRPYALHMLNAIRQTEGIEIVLWTASTQDTAQPVVHQLHERGLVFDHLIYRNELWFTDPIHTKDLRLLGRDMGRVVVFDNAANCVKLNTMNAVLVEDYLGGCDDRAMSDASLVNLYYIIDTLLNHCLNGISVQETLRCLANEQQLCRMIQYNLPEAWQNVDLSGVAPLNVPPHGHYVRACVDSPAPLEHWTI